MLPIQLLTELHQKIKKANPLQNGDYRDLIYDINQWQLGKESDRIAQTLSAAADPEKKVKLSDWLTMMTQEKGLSAKAPLQEQKKVLTESCAAFLPSKWRDDDYTGLTPFPTAENGKVTGYNANYITPTIVAGTPPKKAEQGNSRMLSRPVPWKQQVSVTQFWQTIWDENIERITALGIGMDSSKGDFLPYWSEDYTTKNDTFSITSVVKNSCYQITLTHLTSNKSRTITLGNFEVQDNHPFILSEQSLSWLKDCANSKAKQWVHCSSSFGRYANFTLMVMLQQELLQQGTFAKSVEKITLAILENEPVELSSQEVDDLYRVIEQNIHAIRKNRGGFQTEQQVEAAILQLPLLACKDGKQFDQVAKVLKESFSNIRFDKPISLCAVEQSTSETTFKGTFISSSSSSSQRSDSSFLTQHGLTTFFSSDSNEKTSLLPPHGNSNRTKKPQPFGSNSWASITIPKDKFGSKNDNSDPTSTSLPEESLHFSK